MDVKSDFIYETIEEEVYVCQPLRFEDPDYPDKVYKLVKALYGLHQALRDVKSASTPIETKKPLLKDLDGEDADVYIYRSMIRSLMYLTSSRPDTMFAVHACARFQVTQKLSHLHAVKRIFSDYAGASLDRKSTTGGCQFLGCRLISWQFKKQTVVSTSSIEAEYVAAASCCAQVLWIQNQLLDYGKELASPKQMAFGKDISNLFMAEDVIRRDLHLDDADGVECLANEEIFAELARMGYEKPPPKLTFYKTFFSAQWKFLIHTLF
nr:hypothetical protein [Tanacetum cinerariifolium]